jgi:hypothetical protein
VHHHVQQARHIGLEDMVLGGSFLGARRHVQTLSTANPGDEMASAAKNFKTMLDGAPARQPGMRYP